MAGITGTKKVQGKNYQAYLVGAANALTLIGCLTDFAYKHAIKQIETMCQELGLETDYEPAGHTRTFDLSGVSVDYTPAQVTAGSWGFNEWEAAATAGTVITVAIGMNAAGAKLRKMDLSISDVSEDAKIGDNVTYKITCQVKGAPVTMTLP